MQIAYKQKALPMIYEIATISIDPFNKAAFEAAVAEAAPLFKAANGCHAMKLERVIEHAGEYRLVVEWDSVEAHMVDFRESDAFQKWRALVGIYFASPPVVVHGETVAIYF